MLYLNVITEKHHKLKIINHTLFIRSSFWLLLVWPLALPPVSLCGSQELSCPAFWTAALKADTLGMAKWSSSTPSSHTIVCWRSHQMVCTRSAEVSVLHRRAQPLGISSTAINFGYNRETDGTVLLLCSVKMTPALGCYYVPQSTPWSTNDRVSMSY